MDFNKLDIKRFLIDAIPGRLNNLSPDEFEAFISYLLRLDGYEVDRIPVKNDGTANLLAKKEDLNLVIRVMRYLPDYLIPASVIQQAVAAREFYKSDQSWIITNAGFSEEAKAMAETTDIELWDWNALNQALSDLFFEGRSYDEVSHQKFAPFLTETKEPEIKLKAKWAAQAGISSDWYNLEIILSNPTKDNLYIHLDLPVLIDLKKNQTAAEKWVEEEFIAGILYAGASVRTNALFRRSKLGERPPGGKIILMCHEREPAVTYHLSARLKGEACYLVTYCYSTESAEYKLMTEYRDLHLRKRISGRMFITAYYFISPFLISLASRNNKTDGLIRKIANMAIQYVKRSGQRRLKK